MSDEESEYFAESWGLPLSFTDDIDDYKLTAFASYAYSNDQEAGKK